jgi:hypothetical protein
MVEPQEEQQPAYKFPVRVKMVVSIGYPTAEHVDVITITEEELGSSTLEEYCDDYVEQMARNYADNYWQVLEGDEE